MSSEEENSFTNSEEEDTTDNEDVLDDDDLVTVEHGLTDEKDEGAETQEPAADVPCAVVISNINKEVENQRKFAKAFLRKRGVKTTYCWSSGEEGPVVALLSTPADLNKALALSGKISQGNKLKIQEFLNAPAAVTKKFLEYFAVVKARERKYQDLQEKGRSECTLFIKGLPAETNEKDLRQAFSKAKAWRLPRKASGHIKGFAFIEFDSSNDIQAFVIKRKVNIRGKDIFLDCASGVKQKKTKLQIIKEKLVTADSNPVVLVGNLPSDLDNVGTVLKQLFEKNTVPIKRYRTDTDNSTAIVHLKDVVDKPKALSLTGADLGGSSITVETWVSEKERVWREQLERRAASLEQHEGIMSKEREDVTLFIKNLGGEITVQQLEEAFPGASDYRVPLSKDGKSKGIAYLEFDSTETVERVISQQQGEEVGGRSVVLDYVGAKSMRMTVSKARAHSRKLKSAEHEDLSKKAGKSENLKSKVLKVKGLPFNANNKVVSAMFPGNSNARVLLNTKSGKSQGVAFVEFRTEKAAAQSRDIMNGQELEERTITVDFSCTRPDVEKPDLKRKSARLQDQNVTKVLKVA